MFGYITINEDELKGKELKRYQAYYCGLCKNLRNRHGNRAQLVLTYDMTFLVILLTGLYEPKSKYNEERCTTHFGKKHNNIENEFSAYAADMNLLLSYYNLMDDWEDDKRIERLAYAKTLQKSVEKIALRYQRQAQAVREYISDLKRCEREESDDLDRASGLTGKMLGEIFVCYEDEWASILRKIGFYLGKFIYLMDSYEDIAKDVKKGAYNPLKKIYGTDRFELVCREILQMMAAEASKEFEKLPIVEEVEILRNILYSGMWKRYAKIRETREENGAKKTEYKNRE